MGGKIIAVTANGQRELNQQVTLDGVIATGSQVNVANLVPNVDAVQEIKVMTSSFSAEYGQNSGAIVQIAMKSGTNANARNAVRIPAKQRGGREGLLSEFPACLREPRRRTSPSCGAISSVLSSAGL